MKWIVKAGLSGIFAMILISLFSYVWDFSGSHIVSKTGVTDYTWEPYQRKASMDEGFAWLRMDENGYNNALLSGGKEDILLMGSSHMEAVNVASDENAGYLLNKLLPEYYTYNIGMSGHTIYNCFNNLESVARQYPSEWVVMETDRVELEVDKMRAVINGEFPHIKSYDSGILYYLQKYVPGMKVVYNRITDWICMEETSEKISDKDTLPDYRYINILAEFLSSGVEKLNEGQRLLIVYQPRTEIDENGEYVSTADDKYSEIFRQQCEIYDIEFINLSRNFEELYLSEHILAHGFYNSAVGEGHMNVAGHKVFAEQVAQVIGR